MSELVIRKIADHFARQWGGGGGVMGWVIRDPRIIRWGGRGGVLDPRGSVIRGPPTTRCVVCCVVCCVVLCCVVSCCVVFSSTKTKGSESRCPGVQGVMAPRAWLQ